MRFKDDDGQAIFLVAVAASIFLIGAIGLGIDGSHLYAQRQMAQAAADSAAIAGMMSIFDGTNAKGASTDFSSTAAFTCSTSDARTPCAYASKNGFGGTSADTVAIDFPTSVPGVSFYLNPASNPGQTFRVTVSRKVNTTLLRILSMAGGGASFATIKATATAAIVGVQSPSPIIVTDPKGSQTLSMNGTTSITICGGPSRSIQVNSSASDAYTGGGSVDLSHAGTADPGNCTSGTGADFDVWGGAATNPGSVSLGSTGNYNSKSSPVQDPLANVAAPSQPAAAGTTKSIANGVDGCATSGGCTEYSPGTYASLVPGKNAVIFKPGLYYVQGGGVDFKQTTGGGGAANSYSAMCSGCTADPSTGNGMTIYDTGATATSHTTGGFNVGTLAQITLHGPDNTTTNGAGNVVPAGPYYGVLFWEDRAAQTQTHTLGQGNGCFTLIGTIYITNTLALMQGGQLQTVLYHGTPCSTTVTQGMIIASDLVLKGTTAIKMNLVPYGYFIIRQVALVN